MLFTGPGRVVRLRFWYKNWGSVLYLFFSASRKFVVIVDFFIFFAHLCCIFSFLIVSISLIFVIFILILLRLFILFVLFNFLYNRLQFSTQSKYLNLCRKLYLIIFFLFVFVLILFCAHFTPFLLIFVILSLIFIVFVINTFFIIFLLHTMKQWLSSFPTHFKTNSVGKRYLFGA